MDSVVSLPVAFSFFFRLPRVSVLSGGRDAAAHHGPASAAGRKRGGTLSHEAAPGPREARLRPRVPPGAAGPLGPGSSGRRLTRWAHGGPQGPAGGPAASGRRAVSEHQPDGEPKWRVGRGHTLPRARGPRPRTQLVPSHLGHAWQAGDLNLGPPGCCPPLDHTATPVFQPSLVGCRPRGAGGRLGATSRPGPWPLCHAPHLVFPHSPGCGGLWGWTPKQEWRRSRGREGPDTLGTTCIGGSRATRSDWRRGRQQQARVGRASGPRSRLRRWARRLPREPAGL